MSHSLASTNGFQIDAKNLFQAKSLGQVITNRFGAITNCRVSLNHDFQQQIRADIS